MSSARRRPAATDRALVLRRFRYGESSLLVHLLTPDSGRVVALAKGAYRPTSGYAGVLDLFHGLEVTWQPSRSSEVGLLRTARLVERRRGVTGTLERYEQGCAALELAGLGARAGAADPALFHLTETTLDALDAGRVEPRLAGLAFQLGFLGCMGLTPALEHCAACGLDLRAERLRSVPFAPGAGGRLCPACATEARRVGTRLQSLARPVLRVARSVRDAELAALDRVQLDAALAADLERFVRDFVEYHLESRPRTWDAASLRAPRRRAAPPPRAPQPRP